MSEEPQTTINENTHIHICHIMHAWQPTCVSESHGLHLLVSYASLILNSGEFIILNSKESLNFTISYPKLDKSKLFQIEEA
jgi:hypothetical protein